MELYYENFTNKIKFLKLSRASAFAIGLLALEILKSISPANFYNMTHCRRTYQAECFCCETFRRTFFEPDIIAAYFFQVVFILSEF